MVFGRRVCSAGVRTRDARRKCSMFDLSSLFHASIRSMLPLTSSMRDTRGNDDGGAEFPASTRRCLVPAVERTAEVAHERRSVRGNGTQARLPVTQTPNVVQGGRQTIR